MKQATVNRRIVFLAGVFVLLLAATLMRAIWIQVVKGPEYTAMAISQHRETVVVPAGRGTIVDRSGEPLALGKQTMTVYANPKQVTRARDLTLAAGHLFGVKPADLYPLLTDRSKGFVYIARKVDPLKAEKLKKLGFAGVGFYPEELRFYPQGPIASQLIGYAGLDNRGLEGLERSFDRVLSGKPGSETIVKDPFGRALDVVETKKEVPGGNIRLTIDNQVQANAEAVLRRTVAQWGAKAASAIVMDPYTGEVLAMANAPGFNANRFATTRADWRRNRAVTDTYEPGSTFKLVTLTAALEDHVVNLRTSFVLPPTIHVADRVIHDSHPRGTERLTVEQIIEQSSNVGTVTVAERLGAGRLANWVNRFGFGKPTGIDFPGESSGFALPLDQWSGSTIGTVPIGHGIAVTPVQMARAYSVIANGGILVRPHVVARVDGRPEVRSRGHRIVSKAVVKQVLATLRGVVLDGTGTEAAIPGYTVAGKTGTAAKIDPDGTYSTSRYVASFVGLVPATHPRFVIMVMVDEPHGDFYGGVVAAPAFRDIARFDLQHFEVAPDASRSIGTR